GHARVVVGDPERALGSGGDAPGVDEVGVLKHGRARQVRYKVGLQDVGIQQAASFEAFQHRPVRARRTPFTAALEEVPNPAWHDTPPLVRTTTDRLSSRIRVRTN